MKHFEAVSQHFNALYMHCFIYAYKDEFKINVTLYQYLWTQPYTEGKVNIDEADYQSL